MKYNPIFLLILLLIAVICCQTRKELEINTGRGDTLCPKEIFDNSDSGGVFTGKIVKYSEDSFVDDAFLSLQDNNGDTIIFRVFLESYPKTRNVIKKKLYIGNCGTVIYKTDIVEIEGIEVNRFFYATRLDYP